MLGAELRPILGHPFIGLLVADLAQTGGIGRRTAPRDEAKRLAASEQYAELHIFGSLGFVLSLIH
jgi:hypothetical protein